MITALDVTSQATCYPDALAVGPVVVAAQAVLRLDQTASASLQLRTTIPG